MIRLMTFALIAIFLQPAEAGGWQESLTNDENSVGPSPVKGMQMRSQLQRKDQRQWAEIVVGWPLETRQGDDNKAVGFRLKFSVLVPTDWEQSDELTKVHTFHSGKGGPNYYRIYIKGGQWHFLSAKHSSYAPIKFGVEQTFEIRANLMRDGSDGWVEAFLDQQPTGSSQPQPGQFVPRHEIKLHRRDGVVDDAPYLQIGLDTVRGMPEEVESRVLDWTLISLIY